MKLKIRNLSFVIGYWLLPIVNCLLFSIFYAFPFFCSTNTLLFAQETIDLGEIVITATRDAREIHKIPANVKVITTQDIEKSNAANIVEIIEKFTGIHFRDYSGIGSQAEIDMRGFGENSHGRTLVMLDGRRLNRPDMASINWLQIPLNNVERIEIVSGANSSLYGDNAVAGVINIITKKGTPEQKGKLSTFFGSYAMNDQNWSITGTKDNLSYAFTFERQKNNGYRERTKSSFDGGSVNLVYNFSDNLITNLNFSFNNTKYEMPGELSATETILNRRTAKNKSDDAKQEYQDINLGIKKKLDEFTHLDISFLFGSKEIESNMDSWQNWASPKIKTYAITPKYILDKDIWEKTNKFILGLDYYHESFDMDNFSDRARINKVSTANIEKNSTGFYLNNELNLLENLILTTGFRSEKATIIAKSATSTIIFDDKKDHDGNAFTIGLTHLSKEKSKIFIKYATLYRYPFTDEQASYWGYITDFFNKDLRAEKGKNYELGTNLHLIENLKIGLTLFRIDMKDKIDYNMATWKSENLNDTKHQGFEFDFSYKINENVRIFGNYNYTNAEFTKGANKGKKLPLVPSKRGNLRCEFYPSVNFSFIADALFTNKSYLGGDYSNIGEKLPAYTIVDFTLNYNPLKMNSNLSLSIGIKNVFDKKYSSTGFLGWNGPVFYPSPQRSFTAGISYKF